MKVDHFLRRKKVYHPQCARPYNRINTSHYFSSQLRALLLAFATGMVLATDRAGEKMFGHVIDLERETAYQFERPLRHRQRHLPHYATDAYEDAGSSTEELRPRSRRPTVHPVYIIRTIEPGTGPTPIPETRILPPPPPDPIWRNSLSSSGAGRKHFGETNNVHYIVFLDRSLLPAMEHALGSSSPSRGQCASHD